MRGFCHLNWPVELTDETAGCWWIEHLYMPERLTSAHWFFGNLLFNLAVFISVCVCISWFKWMTAIFSSVMLLSHEVKCRRYVNTKERLSCGNAGEQLCLMAISTITNNDIFLSTIKLQMRMGLPLRNIYANICKSTLTNLKS